MSNGQDSLFGPDFYSGRKDKVCFAGVEIIADSSEKPSGVPDLLAEIGVSVINEPLSAGDYLICRRTLVERKTVQDFAQSLYGGRLFQQIKNLKQACNEVLLLIEGAKWFFSQVRPKPVRSAFLSLLVSWKVPIVFTRNQEESALLLAEIGEKALLCKKLFYSRNFFHRNKIKLSSSKQDTGVRVLSEIPGIGHKLAIRLLERFHTLQGIANSMECDIADVNGIGKIKAAKILDTMREAETPYKV